MTKHQIVVLNETAYSALWGGIVKTGDEDSKRFVKEIVHQQKAPNEKYYYTVEKNILFGFIDEIVEAKVDCDVNIILHNTYSKRDFNRKYPNV